MKNLYTMSEQILHFVALVQNDRTPATLSALRAILTKSAGYILQDLQGIWRDLANKIISRIMSIMGRLVSKKEFDRVYGGSI